MNPTDRDSPTTDPVDITVVVPVYNSSTCLEKLLEQLTAQLESMRKSYEIILVEDCSPDNSWEVIKQIIPHYPNLRAFQLMRNSGQAKATLCGLVHARGEIVFTMDDDLQHRPDQMLSLIEALEQDPMLDCVFGVFRQKKHAGYRNLGSRFLRWMNHSAYNLPASTRTSSFRALRQPLVRMVIQYQTRTPTILALIIESTPRIASVEVEHAERFAGQSNYTLRRQFLLAFDNICSVSMVPLRLVTFMGITFCALSLLMVLVVLIRYLTGTINVAGWTTVVILISFFSGVIMLSLGIMGEYMSRIISEVRGSPPFLIREQRVGGQSHQHSPQNCRNTPHE
jgi:glycosyltransferase involved in cell wall biosynthesis